MQRGPRSTVLGATKRLVSLACRRTALVALTLSGIFAAGQALAWQPSSAHRAASKAIPVAVFGSDDRVPPPAKYKDVQEKIGLFINLRRRTVCTAFCVAPDVIATAGHCLLGTAGDRPARFAAFMFARNLDVVRDQARLGGQASGTATHH